MACRKSGRERVTKTVHDLCCHWARRKQSTGCLIALGALANCHQLPFLTGRRQEVTLTCTHSAHMQQNLRSHRPSDLQYTHKSAILCRIRWPDHQVKGSSSVVVYRLPHPAEVLCPARKPRYCSQSYYWKLLYCIVLQVVGISRKHLEKSFKNLIPSSQHLQEKLTGSVKLFLHVDLWNHHANQICTTFSIISHCSHPHSRNSEAKQIRGLNFFFLATLF